MKAWRRVATADLALKKTLRLSTRTPSTTSSEKAVALRSIRTRTTVPSRIRRAISSFPRSRVPRVPVAFDLAPHAAHRVLGNRALEQRGKRAPHATRVGTRQIAAGDLPRAALIRRQRLAVPFARLAAGGYKPRAEPRPPLPRRCPSTADRSARCAGRRSAATHPQHLRPQLIRWRRPEPRAPAHSARPSAAVSSFSKSSSMKPRIRPRTPRLEGIAPLFTNQHVCCICRHWRHLLRRPLTAGST